MAKAREKRKDERGKTDGKFAFTPEQKWFLLQIISKYRRIRKINRVPVNITDIEELIKNLPERKSWWRFW